MENFSKKFQSPKQINANAPKGSEEDGDKRKKRKMGNENILAQTKTDQYADDESLYVPRYTKKQRLEYWALQMQNPTSRELKIPDNFDSWIKNEIADTVDHWFRFPSRLTYLFAFIRSNNWDQWFINFFIFWLCLAIFIGDGWAAKYAPFQLNMQSELIIIPIIAMLICQIVPFLGTIYYMNYCYDLVHYSAQINFSQWAFVSALTAQFIEYFYYGGRGRRDAAGRCAYGEEDHPPNTAMLRWIKGKIKSITARTRKKDAKIADIESAAADEDAVKEEKSDPEKVDMAVVVAENKMELDDESTVGALHPSDSLEAAADQGNESEKEVEYADWVCVVCGKENHRPRHPFIERDLIFGTQGIHFKRLTVAIKPRRDMPECAKCFTYMDYKPPAATKHLFSTVDGRYDVFKDYPRVPRMQAALKTDNRTRRMNKVYSFFFGTHESEASAGLFNDWRLRMYVRGIFPEPFRVVLPPDERYREGEIVECRQQKADWYRAKIIHVRFNNTYDVKYDTGDEVRFVAPAQIRLLAEKKPFAYAVELGMAMLVLSFPLCLLLSVSSSPGLLCLGLLLVSAVLLGYRMLLFVQYVYNYSNAGCYQISVINLIFTLPLLLSMIAAISAVASAGPVQWTGVAIQLIIAMYFSLPALYMIRRTYALIGVVLFTLTAISLYLMAAMVDNTLGLPYRTAIAVFPALVFLGICKYIRKHLHTIWDVCLVIRPARDVSFSNVSIITTLRKKLSRG